MSPPLAPDTSVALPLVLRTHVVHATVERWLAGRQIALSGHALAETYSVMTRLPGDARFAPADAAQLLVVRFSAPLLLGAETYARLPEVLARLGVAGGAVYDALVALAAQEHGAVLATRGSRARATYEAVGVAVAVVPG